jgi:RimJ/RimL family protein N-acetyltransferase
MTEQDISQPGSTDYTLDVRVIQVREIRPDDTDRLRALHAHLSVDSIVHRFFYYLPALSEELAAQFTHMDERNTMAFIATIGAGSDEQIIGVARYCGVGSYTAEVAFTVLDQWQGHGIAKLLLHRLAAYACEQGYTTFVAYIMPDNLRMLNLVRSSGFPFTLRNEEGNVVATLDISHASQQVQGE